jgi:ribosome-associated heat shock protein Hsp15
VDCQRIDKWLWHARVVRTRSAAAALTAAGYVRINGRRVTAPSHAVRRGDVVTVALDRAVHVLKVLGFSERRGSADAARRLCEALDPPAGSLCKDAAACAQSDAGRRTTQAWHAIDRRTNGEGDGD